VNNFIFNERVGLERQDVSSKYYTEKLESLPTEKQSQLRNETQWKAKIMLGQTR